MMHPKLIQDSLCEIRINPSRSMEYSTFYEYISLRTDIYREAVSRGEMLILIKEIVIELSS